jgi:hypothetical protein
MAGRRGDDGGWMVEPPEDPDIFAEILDALKALPAETRAMAHSHLTAVTSESLVLKDRIALLDNLHDVYLVPPNGRVPCWVIAVNGYTGRPIAAGLLVTNASRRKAEFLALRVVRSL